MPTRTRLPVHESGPGARLVERMTCSILRGATMTEEYSVQRHKVGTRSKRHEGERTMSKNISCGSEMTGSSSSSPPLVSTASPSASPAAVHSPFLRGALGFVGAGRLSLEPLSFDKDAVLPEKPGSLAHQGSR